MLNIIPLITLGAALVSYLLYEKSKEEKHGPSSVINNLPRLYEGPIHTWPKGKYTHYHYRVFDKKEKLNDIYYTKIFDDLDDTSPEMYQAILRGIPTGRLPYIKGIKKVNKQEKIIYADALDGNILSAGLTRSGKTNDARVYLLSLMYFAHPEYLKIVILDPKSSDFKTLIK